MLQCSSHVTASLRRACSSSTSFVRFCKSCLLPSRSSCRRSFSSSSIISCFDIFETTEAEEEEQCKGKEVGEKPKDCPVWDFISQLSHCCFFGYWETCFNLRQPFFAAPSVWCLPWLALAFSCRASSWPIRAWFSCKTRSACCWIIWLQRDWREFYF